MSEQSERPFKLGASYTIGSHILPGEPISKIGEQIQQKISLNITTCDTIIEGVKEGIFDLGLIETPLFDEALEYQEWMEDELVVCSKMPIPDSINRDEIKKYKLIARQEDSLTRMVISNFLNNFGLSYKSFKSLSEIDNATAAIQSIKWSKPNIENPTIAIVSQLAIENELKNNELYISRIENHPLIRKFYLIYNKDKGEKEYIDKIIKILKSFDKRVEISPLLAS
jgi:DNA-binding transcriptional LysR family regulator